MSSISKSRIRIFDYWQIQQPSLQSEPAPRQSFETQFGDDLIGEAQRLISNVSGFLESRQTYQKKISTLRIQIDDLLAILHKECNSEQEEEALAEANLKLYRTNLKKLYVCLRGGKLLQNRIQNCFLNANLTNYDPTITQLAFTEPPQVMKSRLEETFKALKHAMHMVMQGQKLLQSHKQLSSIFRKEHLPSSGLQRLEQQLRHQNLVKIHFLMIYQLQEVAAMKENLSQMLAVAQTEYLKYQLVLDSLLLMKAQTSQMQQQLDQAQLQIENACEHPEYADVKKLALRAEARTQDWSRNIRIYQANLSNFTRANVQTNMVYYSYLKAGFVEQLDIFAQNGQKQQNYSKSLLFLLDRNGLMVDIKRRLQLISRISEPDRRLALNIYNETSSHVTPSDIWPLQNLKQGLLAQIQVLLVNNGIAYNKRAKDRVTLQQDILKHRSLIQKIEGAPTKEQYSLFNDDLVNINAAAFQLQAIFKDKERLMNRKQGESEEEFRSKISTIHSYLLALIYAGAIAKRQDFSQKLQALQSINQKNRFSDLPLKFQHTLFNYIHDISILEDSKNAERQLEDSLRKVSQGLKEYQGKSKLRGNIDLQVEKGLQHLRQAWFDLHHRYFRRVSNYGEQLLLDHLLHLTNQATTSVREAVGTECQLVNPKKMDIDRKTFFSHRILSELLSLATINNSPREILKIVNLLPTLQEVFNTLDREFIGKSFGGKLSDLVKLGLLQQYFEHIYERGNVWRAVRTLRWTAYLQIVSQLYPSTSLRKETVLQALLRIQLQMGFNVISFKVNDDAKSFLSASVPSLMKEMRKLPLTLAARHDISGFTAVWRFEEIIEQLRGTLRSRLPITEVATIFVCINELKDSRKASESNYQAYQNAVVKEKKEIQEYFSTARSAFKPRIDAISSEIELATKNFLNSDESVSLFRAIQALSKKVQ